MSCALRFGPWVLKGRDTDAGFGFVLNPHSDFSLIRSDRHYTRSSLRSLWPKRAPPARTISTAPILMTASILSLETGRLQ